MWAITRFLKRTVCQKSVEEKYEVRVYCCVEQTTLDPIKPSTNLSPTLGQRMLETLRSLILRANRYLSNVIASVLMTQQITHLISPWTGNIICRDYSAVVPPPPSPLLPVKSGLFDSLDDPQMDRQRYGKWEGNHQPPGLIRSREGGWGGWGGILLFWQLVKV